MSINKVAITGNLGADPELRSTAKGTSVLTFRVAVNERVPDGTGGWEDKAHWFRCAVFGKRAEGLARILRKGSHVGVSGKLREETWEKNGERRSTVSIVADEVDTTFTPKAECAPPPSAEPPASLYDDDIPF